MIIRAVVDGRHLRRSDTKRFRGITGYLFRSDDLRKYRPVADVKYQRKASSTTGRRQPCCGSKPAVIRGLIVQGVLTAPTDFETAFPRLIPAKEVQQFAEHYVATDPRQTPQSQQWFACRHLRESGTPLLAIPIPEPGKGHASFLQKDVAARIQLPSRKMLREAAQRRIVDARKKQWAEYRQAREAALGKPIRRVRVNCER